MPWMDGVLKALHLSFPPPHGSQPMEPDILMEPFTKLTALTEDVELPNNFSNLFLKSENFVNAQATFSVNVVSNERTTKEHHFQEVRKIVFSIPETLSYTPGDLLLVQPENSMESVDYLIDFLGINANNRVTFSSPRKSPTLCTIRDLFTKYLDFNGRPTRYFFELLSHFATASHEREKLLELSLPANLEDLYAYAHRPRRTKLEVLRDFPTLRRRIPLEYVIDVFGWMEPRAFSICSSMKKHVGELHVCYAVVRYKTSLLLPRMGVCTNWMKSLESGFKVECCWVEPGTLRLPEDNSTTLLMIGPGTGVAPFRAFIEERSFEFNKTGCLVFGNRYKAQDYLFGEEWEEYINNGQLHVITAFSRDQELKVYVQHKIRENGRYIWNLINRGAYVYICGNARRMPEDVMNALMEVIQLFGPMTLKSAEEYVSRMRKERRLHTETCKEASTTLEPPLEFSTNIIIAQ
ncbi:NADPH-dependent diflavin oxidoreductase 1-like isoform X2 [Zophobas morio]|uniref:NADPH-dependent diflavin oxidoreductase 1-like isoform X2 n=1 Tax=Zophobas morio TaxID=2755281 RepID=UPI003083B94B